MNVKKCKVPRERKLSRRIKVKIGGQVERRTHNHQNINALFLIAKKPKDTDNFQHAKM